MEQRGKLIELIGNKIMQEKPKVMGINELAISITDNLIANGVVVLPCRCGKCEQRIGGNFCKHLNMSVVNDSFYCAGGKRKGGDDL